MCVALAIGRAGEGLNSGDGSGRARSGQPRALPPGRRRPRTPLRSAAAASAPSRSGASRRVQGEADGTGGGGVHTAQRVDASTAHWESQVTLQQKASAPHTAAQQASFSHEGEPLAAQQSPMPAQVAPLQAELGQRESASAAQVSSQALPQQDPSDAHTSWQQAVSSQPGVPLAAQQSPGPGQAAPLQAEQTVCAVAAQLASQTARQQKGSSPHTC